MALPGWGTEEKESLGCPIRGEAQPVLPAQQREKQTLHGKHHSFYGRAQMSMEVGQFFPSPMPVPESSPNGPLASGAVNAAE